MKKLLIASLALFGATGAVAAFDSIDELNAELTKVLAPYQNPTTTALLSFGKIELSSERALSVALSAYYEKLGSQNTLEIHVPYAGYDYADGKPVSRLTGSVKLDLTKLLPQDQLNELIPNVESFIADLASQLSSEYGEAVSVTTEITDRQQDKDGNFTAVKGSIRFAIDLSKLPETMPASEVPVIGGEAIVAVEVTKGFSIDLNVNSNTAYKGFDSNQTGLKEYLEALLARSPELFARIADFVKQLDEGAKGIVETGSTK